MRPTIPGINFNIAAPHSWIEMLFSGSSQFKWITQGGGESL